MARYRVSEPGCGCDQAVTRRPRRRVRGSGQCRPAGQTRDGFGRRRPRRPHRPGHHGRRLPGRAVARGTLKRRRGNQTCTPAFTSLTT